MREAVLHLSGYNYQNIYGINYRVKEKITMADLALPRPARDQDGNRRHPGPALAQQCRSHHRASPAFVDATHVRVDQLARTKRPRSADTIIIATGTKPATMHQSAASTAAPSSTATRFWTCADIPKTLIVVGGGVIGVEYTCMFATLGVRVILVEKRPRLLEFADAEMVEALSYHLRDHRVTMRLNEEVASVEENGRRRRGGATWRARRSITGDALLYAVGRQGNVDELNLDAAGIEADARGRIKVDAEYRTKQPHIFAVGDVIGFPSLASVSMEQGRIAAAQRRSASRFIPTPRPTLTAFTPFRRFPSSARPKSN